MNRSLPDGFPEAMRLRLGDEMAAFLRAMEEEPVRGIRLNPMKTAEGPAITDGCDRISWIGNGFYLPPDSAAGNSVLHEAGAWYIQDPSAMIPVAVLNPQPGETVLDLCAAPGGKSTQIGEMMRGEGLLVCNEPVLKRARVLSGNVERMGIPNAAVVSALPGQLAQKWPEGFDAVLVDAPCSGEGMFRKNPETRDEWSEERVRGCAERQREILSAAVRMVRPGGRIVYSTCTFSAAENEENAAWLTTSFPDFEPLPFSLPGVCAPEGTFTCWPQRIRGEGQFIAAFRRKGDGEARLPGNPGFRTPDRETLKVFRSCFPALPEATHFFGATLIHAPGIPDLSGIKTLRAGLHLGEVKGKVALPDHAAAQCFARPPMPGFQAGADDAVRYLAGETIPGDAEGWVLILYRNLALGWGKGSGGIIRNHYPKGLRRFHLLP